LFRKKSSPQKGPVFGVFVWVGRQRKRREEVWKPEKLGGGRGSRNQIARSFRLWGKKLTRVTISNFAKKFTRRPRQGPNVFENGPTCHKKPGGQTGGTSKTNGRGWGATGVWWGKSTLDRGGHGTLGKQSGTGNRSKKAIRQHRGGGFEQGGSKKRSGWGKKCWAGSNGGGGGMKKRHEANCRRQIEEKKTSNLQKNQKLAQKGKHRDKNLRKKKKKKYGRKARPVGGGTNAEKRKRGGSKRIFRDGELGVRTLTGRWMGGTNMEKKYQKRNSSPNSRQEKKEKRPREKGSGNRRGGGEEAGLDKRVGGGGGGVGGGKEIQGEVQTGEAMKTDKKKTSKTRKRPLVIQKDGSSQWRGRP